MTASIEEARRGFRERLLEAGVLVVLGEPGLYAKSGVFERVYRGVDALTETTLAHLGAEVLRFPPVEPLALFEKTDYIASFPQLTASLSVFTGGDLEHAELLTARAEGERWERFLEPAGVLMSPAVCHPVYALLTGTLPAGGRNFDVLGDSFRREPSEDPMRMQAFHMHEYVHVGTAVSALAHRDEGAPLMHALLESLGLEIDYVPANDPFFGRAGRMLAKNQITQSLKYEFVTPVYGDAHDPTAISSANYHETHFGQAFDIRDADGEVANSSCLAFGLERITLALFARHGTDLGSWPAGVRARLGADA
ncbi:MAG: amino acid--[acyl-carrier-protein] ligase [Actinomycetales bacterium]|nr:amino acid--[acyl-carrier-protein] ligase [Actinomycetales bacterium]